MCFYFIVIETSSICHVPHLDSILSFRNPVLVRLFRGSPPPVIMYELEAFLKAPGQVDNDGGDMDTLSIGSDEPGEDGIDGDDDGPSRRMAYRDKNAKPEINMKVPSNHFDFGAIFPLLSHLEEVVQSYRTQTLKVLCVRDDAGEKMQSKSCIFFK